MNSERKSRSNKKTEILKALEALCLENGPPSGGRGALPELHRWPKTRQISDRCDTSIYVTRAILLQLVEEGKVLKSPELYFNSLRWYIRKR